MPISLPSGTQAELIAPEGEPKRGLVIVPDIGGLRPLFTEMATTLSRENSWTVCVPEPFPGREDMELAERMEAMAGLDDDRQLADIVAAADATEAEPVGVIGFCMGGMYAMKAAGTGRFDRAVSFYGMIRVPEQWRGPGQADAIDAVRTPEAAPVLAVIGTVDPWTPSEEVEELEAAGATVVRYEGADHGFVHDPDRPAHRPDDAEDAWQRAVEFLSEPL